MIKILLSNVLASASDLNILTAKMVRGRSVQFKFLTPEWDSLHKTAVFTNGSACVIVREHNWNDNVVDIPPEVLEFPNRIVKCGVYGTDADGKILPTLWATLGTVFPSAYPSGTPTESVPPTPAIWEDLQLQIGNISELKTEEKRNLVGAINELYSAIDSVDINSNSVLDHIILRSSTDNSKKLFKLTVDDSGVLSVSCIGEEDVPDDPEIPDTEAELICSSILGVAELGELELGDYEV